MAAGQYHHHVGLNTWHSEGAAPVKLIAAGMYHDIDYARAHLPAQVREREAAVLGHR